MRLNQVTGPSAEVFRHADRLLAGAVLGAGAAGVVVAAAALLCFLCLRTLVVGLLVSVVEVEGAGVCAIAVPRISARPAKAEMMVFMMSFILFFFGSRYFGFHNERRSSPLRADEAAIKVSKEKFTYRRSAAAANQRATPRSPADVRTASCQAGGRSR